MLVVDRPNLEIGRLLREEVRFAGGLGRDGGNNLIITGLFVEESRESD